MKEGNKIKFSIMIINWNGRKNLGEFFEKCLESVVNTTYDNFEVIFIDNASIDGSYEYARSKFNFKFFKNKENLGGIGRNVIINENLCSGDVIAFLDNDTIVDQSWLDEPSKLFENPKIGVVQANLRMLNEPTIPDSTGHVISSIGIPIENTFFMDEPSKPVSIFGGKGAALFVRRELFERLGGFDEDYFFYFEETDLCWRARLLGYEVYFSPNSIVLHKGGGTFRNGKLLYHRQKNTIASMIKCYELKNLLKYLPLRLLFELAGIFYLLFKKPSLAFGNMKALIWVVIKMRKLMSKRREVQIGRIVSDKELFERDFIIKSLNLTIKYLRSRFKRFEEVAFR